MIRLKYLLSESVSSDPRFIAYIKDQEGNKKDQKTGLHKAYKDSVGVWTIGYGHTGNVRSDQTWTEKQAESQLKRDLIDAEQQARNYIKNKFPNKSIDTNQVMMLTDFVFNLGLGGLSKFPKFVRAIVHKDWNTAVKNYKRYADGKELTKRNNAFYEIFLKPELQRKVPISTMAKIGNAIYPLKKNGFVNVREESEVNAGWFDNLLTVVRYPNPVGTVTRKLVGADGKNWFEVILKNGETGFVRSDVVTTTNPNRYTVQPGDTLTKISKNTGISIDKLKQLNNLKSDAIQVDQQLKLR